MKKLLTVLLSLVMAMSLMVPAFAAAAPETAVPISAFLPEASSDESFGIIGGQDGPTAILISSMPDWADADWENMDSEEWNRLFNEKMKEELGGVPGQIGVMVNGEYVQFPDAVPELKDGCLMVPIRALAEVLGGQVAYSEEEKEQLVKAADKTYLTFSVGNPQVIVDYPSGSGELVTLSCAPYIKNDRAYVPVRFMGEVLGYEVGWDSAYQTAILLDREAFAAEIDKNFTILNKVQAASAASMEKGKNLSAEMKGDVTVTVMDETYTAELAGKSLQSTEAASGSCSITLSDNTIDVLLETFELDGPDAEIVRDALEGLKDIQVIMTQEGKFWFHAAALDVISEEENVWYGMDMGELLGAQLNQAFAGANSATMGSALAAMVDQNSVLSYSTIVNSAQWMIGIYGDENFTTSNGKSTVVIDADSLDPTGAMGMKDLYKECKITMTVDSKGGATATAQMETNAKAGVPSMKMTVDCTQSGGKTDLTMTIQMDNICEVTMDLTATQKTTSEKPMTEPPADANVTDIPMSLNF